MITKESIEEAYQFLMINGTPFSFHLANFMRDAVMEKLDQMERLEHVENKHIEDYEESKYHG